MTDVEKSYLDRLENKIYSGDISNEFLVSLMKLSETYLGLIRIKDYAKEVGKTEQSIRRYHKNNIIKICNHQLIINNS